MNRRGFGKMRHLDIRDLWLQEEVEKGRLEVGKIRGDQNPADLMTKVLNVDEVVDRLSWMGLVAEVKKGKEDLGEE